MSSTIIPSGYPISDFPTSRIRRKPVFTYKSPSANDTDPLVALPTLCNVPYPSSEPTRINFVEAVRNIQHPPREGIQAANYSLPLYHPFGRLALSLPPLDPTDLGLLLPNIPEGASRGSSGRFHGLLAKIRNPDEEGRVIVPTVSSIAAVAAGEVRRASPQKKRLGGSNGKRRRKAADDGDTVYPVKRTRQTRGGVGDENDLDAAQAGDDDVLVAGGPVEQRPERPSTRSRTKRRDSSEIEDRPIHDLIPVTEETIKHSAGSVLGGVSQDSTEVKEEGEIVE